MCGRVADRLLRAHEQEPVTGLDVFPGLCDQISEHQIWMPILKAVPISPTPSPLRLVIFFTRLWTALALMIHADGWLARDGG